jgi:hypothetical protein
MKFSDILDHHPNLCSSTKESGQSLDGFETLYENLGRFKLKVQVEHGSISDLGGATSPNPQTGLCSQVLPAHAALMNLPTNTHGTR